MRRCSLVEAFLLSFLGVSLLAQDPDSALLRNLTKPLPQLPVTRVELKASPSLTFEGISAVTTDKQGNIYVIHRPRDAVELARLLRQRSAAGATTGTNRGVDLPMAASGNTTSRSMRWGGSGRRPTRDHAGGQPCVTEVILSSWIETGQVPSVLVAEENQGESR